MCCQSSDSKRGIPRSHRFARSRPLTLCEGGVRFGSVRGGAPLPTNADAPGGVPGASCGRSWRGGRRWVLLR